MLIEKNFGFQQHVFSIKISVPYSTAEKMFKQEADGNSLQSICAAI